MQTGPVLCISMQKTAVTRNHSSRTRNRD